MKEAEYQPTQMYYISEFAISILVKACTETSMLSVRTFFHQIYHVYRNFILGCICRITVIFLTLKDGSLLINIFCIIVLATEASSKNGVDAL